MELTLSFYFPLEGFLIGGTQVLFVRIIKYLANNTCVKIRLYDYENGTVRQLLKKEGIYKYEFVAIEKDFFKLKNLGNETFVLSVHNFPIFPFILKEKSNVKFLFWDLYYPWWNNALDLFIKNYLIIPAKSYLKKMLSIFIKKKALVILPESVNFFEKFWGQNINKNAILNIPIDIQEKDYKFKKQLDKVIRITYIGRSEFWKVSPVKKLIRDLKKNNISFKIYIITDFVDDFINNLNEEYDDSFIDIRDSLYGKELEYFLLSNTDLGYGMGMSAIEFAKIGIPTILTDASHSEFPDNYQYQWLCDNDGLGLGVDIELDHWHGKRNIVDMINELQKDSFNIIGKNCFNYVKKYNSNKEVVDKLLYFASHTEMTIREFEDCWLLKIRYWLIKIKYLLLRLIRFRK